MHWIKLGLTFPAHSLLIKDVNWCLSRLALNTGLRKNLQRIPQYCTEVRNENVKVKKDSLKISSATEDMQGTKEIIKSIEKNYINGDIQYVPSRFLRRTKQYNQGIIIDDSVAKTICDWIVDDLNANGTFIVEMSPGLGKLTKCLLDAGIPKIHVYESHSSFVTYLKTFDKKYQERMDIRNYNLYLLWNMRICDFHDEGNRTKTAFEGVQTREYENEPSMHVICMLPSMSFIKQLMLFLVTKSNIMFYGRPVFYMAIPPSYWAKLNATRSDGYTFYRSISILFQTFFNYQKLGTIPRSALLPWPIKPSIRIKMDKNLRQNDYEHVFIVRVEPKANLYTEILKESSAIPFWFFVLQTTVSRTTRIIPKLEDWVPGCGISLIPKGIDIFTEFGELDPEQIVDLYRHFRKLPGLEKSSFNSLMDSYMSKCYDYCGAQLLIDAPTNGTDE